MWDILAQIIATIGAIIGFTEWKYKSLHGCLERIENRLDNHLEHRRK